MPIIEYIESLNSIGFPPSFREVSVDSVKIMNDFDGVLGETIEKISFPSLEILGYTKNAEVLYGKTFPCLREICFPKLKRLRTWGTYRPGAPRLTRVILGPIEYVYSWSGISIDFTKHDDINLMHYEFGEYITTNIDIREYTPSNAMDKSLSNLIEDIDLFTNNLEQFLYNFRTYIIDRLYDYAHNAKHTLTINTIVYNIVLGLDEEGYANTFHMPYEPSIDYVTSLNQKLTDINWGLA